MGSSPIVTVGVGVAGLLGFLLWRNYRKSEVREQAFRGLPEHDLEKRKRGDKIPAYFVDPNTGEVIEVDQRTAKYRREGETEFRGSSRNMLKTIASESRSPEEFARRAEAWASSESKRPSDIAIARAYKGRSPHMLRLIREAREARQHGSRKRFQSLIAQHGDGLEGTPAEHADEARRFFRSAAINFNQHEHRRNALACSNIEHMTDVIAEASIAGQAADQAGDKMFAAQADKLVHDATMKQRALVEMCRRRERALAITGQGGSIRRRRR